MKPSNDKARVTAPEAARVLCFVFAAVLVIQAIITLFCANFSVGVILNFAYAAFVCLCGVLLGKVGRVLRIIATAAVIAPLIFGCALFACGAKDNADGSEKAIIVLGCGIDGERISPKLARRLDKAIEYFNEHPDKPVIVSGGQGAQEDIPESTAMKRYLVSKGVPDGMIIEESRATSTSAHFVFSSALPLGALGRAGAAAVPVADAAECGMGAGDVPDRPGLCRGERRRARGRTPAALLCGRRRARGGGAAGARR